MSDPVPGSTRWFETELSLEAPRSAVWAAIANATGLQQWFAPEAEIEGRPGGRVLWQWTDFFTWTQRIEVWEPGTRLLTRYDSAVDDGHGGKRPLFVDFSLSGEGGRTTLRVVHSGFGDDAGFDSEYDGIRAGWPVELASLRLWLEQHPGARRALAWSHRTVADDPDTAWQRLLGRDGLGALPVLANARPDEPFSWTSPAGDTFEGRVVIASPREFVGIATSHRDAFLRLWADALGEATHVWVWLATYGRPASETAALQERHDRMLARLFPDIAAPVGRERS